MPTVSVFQDSLKDALGEEMSEKIFDELCFEFGLELDEVTSEYEMAKKERGEEAARELSQRVIFKVDVPANRYDLLCIEGLVLALRIFKGKIELPRFKLVPPRPNIQMFVKASAAQIRPYVCCAILRGVTFDDDRYKSFLDLQDKLHQNICRRRTLASIGTHDLSTLTPPFYWEARDPKDIHFVPLYSEGGAEVDGHGLMRQMANHQQLKAYLPIIRESPVYPVIMDSAGVVASLPPIINSEHSKISTATRDVFIEVTATDFTKASIVLNTLVAMFSQHCDKPFEVEPVEVIYQDDYPANNFTKGGDHIIYPQLEPRPMTANIDRMKQSLGLERLSSEEVRDYIKKMSVPCEVDASDKKNLLVQVPITRSDIMHECDLIEDLAIAYNYMNLTTIVPECTALPAEQPVNHLTDLLRVEMAMAGFNECLNWGLLSMKENFHNLRREPKPEEIWRTTARPDEYIASAAPVSLSNPKTAEFEIVRTSLLPGLLKTLHSNKHNSPPIKLFEISDVVIQDPSRETGAKNQRRVAALHASLVPAFEIIHGLLDQLMFALDCCYEHKKKLPGNAKKTPFKLVESSDPAFIKGRQASVVVTRTVEGEKDEVAIGVLGVLHPQVLSSRGFDVALPTSALEVNIEMFLDLLGH